MNGLMSNTHRKLNASRTRRVRRVRARVTGTTARPRLAVHRSLQRISAQVIDDTTGKTLATASEHELAAKDVKGKKPVEIAHMVGILLAAKAKKAKVTQVVFDRRDKRYHGRVKALADGAREGGLEF
jgi:large subunit ribosomal protein L18